MNDTATAAVVEMAGFTLSFPNCPNAACDFAKRYTGPGSVSTKENNCEKADAKFVPTYALGACLNVSGGSRKYESCSNGVIPYSEWVGSDICAGEATRTKDTNYDDEILAECIVCSSTTASSTGSTISLSPTTSSPSAAETKLKGLWIAGLMFTLALATM